MSEIIAKALTGTIGQDEFDNASETSIRRMIDAKMPNELIQMYEAQWHGGKCVFCGASFERRHVFTEVRDKATATGLRVIADYYDYTPSCECLEKYEQKTETDIRIAAAMERAEVPRRYRHVSFATWDENVGGPALNRAMAICRDYAGSGKWKERGLFLYGNIGTGKTHCAVSAARTIIQLSRENALFVPAVDLVNRMLAKDADEFMEHVQYVRVLIVDDIDKLRSMTNDWVRERVFSILDAVTREKRALITTSNIESASQVYETFPPAFASRLVGYSDFVEFVGTDKRLEIE